MTRLVIDGLLPSLNEYIAAERRNKYVAANLKRRTQDYIRWLIKQQIPDVRFVKPVFMRYTWYERSRARDKDNVAFAKKFVQDALVEAGTLRGDGWRDISGFSDTFAVDKEHPRVEIEIREDDF